MDLYHFHFKLRKNQIFFALRVPAGLFCLPRSGGWRPLQAPPSSTGGTYHIRLVRIGSPPEPFAAFVDRFLTTVHSLTHRHCRSISMPPSNVTRACARCRKQKLKASLCTPLSANQCPMLRQLRPSVTSSDLACCVVAPALSVCLDQVDRG